YARFYTKVVRDLGLVKVDEPFIALLSQGMVIKDGAKMSKSKGNVVSDDFIREKYGADTGRLFELFAAPPEKDLEWNDHGVEGASRFLNRVWRFVLAHLDEVGGAGRPADGPPDRERAATVPTPSTEAGRAFRRQIHETIQRVTADIEHDFHFTTALRAIQALVNALYAFEAMCPDAVPAAARRVEEGVVVPDRLVNIVTRAWRVGPWHSWRWRWSSPPAATRSAAIFRTGSRPSPSPCS